MSDKAFKIESKNLEVRNDMENSCVEISDGNSRVSLNYEKSDELYELLKSMKKNNYL